MKKLILILSALAVLAGLSHYVVFPEESECILVPFKGFKRIGNMYISPQATAKEELHLKALVERAEKRNAEFWGGLKGSPTYIYCATDEEFLNFGGSVLSPAVVKAKLDGYIVIGKKGLGLDIVSHERSHIELYERLGFFKYNFEVPMWFNEGLAMQIDRRQYYDEESLMSMTNGLETIPEVEHLISASDFVGSSAEENRMNYMASRYQVGEWLKSHDLEGFIQKMKEGFAFNEAYND